MPSIHDFATWAPLVRLLTVGSPEKLLVHGGSVVGAVARRGTVYTSPVGTAATRAAQWEAEQLISAALRAAGLSRVGFDLRVSPALDAVLDLFAYGPGMGPALSPYPESIELVDGAVAEPWRRLPEPVPGVKPASTADPERLERLLRERLPDAVGVRPDIALPAELATLYRVAGGGDHDDALGFHLLPLDEVTVADAGSRWPGWHHGATEAVRTPPGAAVQGLPGSPGWIVFAGDGGTCRFAVDLTPGPGGHVGQIITLDHQLVADSLTDLVEHGRLQATRPAASPAVARINAAAFTSVEAAAHPDLEVLAIGRWDGEPLSLAAVAGLPRLRTLRAQTGTLADPMEIAGLTALEYLAVGIPEWRVLLAAGAVPRGLSAAGIEVEGDQRPHEVVAVANELLARWHRPLITGTTIEGKVG